jgi:hypothetical protein
MKPTTIPRMTVGEWVRFWSKVSIGNPHDCWLWKEHVDKDGYPPFRLRRHRYKAARIALFLVTGRDPGDLLACHTCNNPRCCNPAHLYPGTQSENLRQAVEQRRAFIGSINGNAKLSGADVQLIRASSEPGPVLARRFLVSKPTIYSIKKGRTWKHLLGRAYKK